MTITDANALNVVLRYLLGLDPLPSDNQAREAATRLAGRANKVLGAGLTCERVDEAWQHVIVCPAQDGVTS